MRILFVHHYCGAHGGAECNVRLTADELRQRGHEVALLFRRTSALESELWDQTFSQKFRLPSLGNTEYVEAVLEQFSPHLIYLHNLDDVQVVQALTASHVPVARMVHDHGMYCLRTYKYNYFTRGICTKPAGAACVFPCMASVLRNRQGGFPLKWGSLRDKLLEIEANKRCAAFVVYSDYCRTELIRNGFPEAKIHLCAPVPSLHPEGSVSSFSNRNLLLFAGQIIRGKGVDLLLQALSRLRENFECSILGDGSHRSKCERLSRRLGLSGKVRFEGYLPAEKSRQLYLEASLLVMSSVWPEPFGMVGPEAMRYGLPVVAFDAGGIREWLLDGENGFLVPWKDTAALAAKIDQLLADKALARKLGRNGLERVHREYNAAHQIDRLERLFLQLSGNEQGIGNESNVLTVINGSV